MNALDSLAMAIFKYEGGTPTSRNMRNNNPGNLRPLEQAQPHDAGGYRTFACFADGWQALLEDLGYKLKHHLTPQSTLLELMERYAPAGDHNHPSLYARFLCQWLSQALGKTITTMTPVGEIFDL